MTDLAEQLFGSETVPVAGLRSARDPLSGAVALDREQRLVRVDDGLYARRVCLHSLDKAHYASYYADIVGTAMKRAYPGPLAWIELFAGPGELYVKDLALYHAGSPVEAVSIRDPFDHYFFATSIKRAWTRWKPGSAAATKSTSAAVTPTTQTSTTRSRL